jgi:hypothetical protein
MYSLNKKQGGPQSWSGCFGEKKNLLSVFGFKPWTVQPVA